jgi:acetyl esterase
MPGQLHPQIQAMIDTAVANDVPPIHRMSVADARARSRGRRLLLGDGPDVAHVGALRIPGPARPIDARYVVPHEPPAGLLVYLHGGGWVVGEIEDYDPLCRMLATACGLAVLSVGYRLAPEHPFPAAVEDAYAATVWAAEHLLGDGRLVLAGDSAGGNLAAVCTQEARRLGGPKIAFQVLVYPVTDHDFERASYAEHGTGYLLGRDEMAWFWDHYVPDEALRDDPRASPLRAADLEDLPPALVLIAEYDPLRDEGLAYARRLEEAGVPVTVRRYDDVTHGFFALATYAERADEAVAVVGAAVRAALAG